MRRRAGIGTIAAVLSVAVVLLLPAAGATAGGAQVAAGGGGPVATKSGALVNYTQLGKLTIARHMFIHFSCTAACSVTATDTLKGGRGDRLTLPPATGTVPANSEFVVEVIVSKRVVRVLRAAPGRFKLINSITATDPATGVTETITNAFRFKR